MLTDIQKTQVQEFLTRLRSEKTVEPSSQPSESKDKEHTGIKAEIDQVFEVDAQEHSIDILLNLLKHPQLVVGSTQNESSLKEANDATSSAGGPKSVSTRSGVTNVRSVEAEEGDSERQVCNIESGEDQRQKMVEDEQRLRPESRVQEISQEAVEEQKLEDLLQ